MIVFVVILSLIGGALLLHCIRTEKELRALAQFLMKRDTDSNSRVTISLRSKGFVQVGRAINSQLDLIQAERINIDEQQHNLQRGLTALSHDIRTPLTGARGYLQLLEEEYNPAMRDKYRTAVIQRLDEVGQLLDQLYAFSQIQDPDYRVEQSPVDANAVLSEVLASLYPQFIQKEWKPWIMLEDERCMVEGNSEALKRIFANLTINALRYGTGAPTITQKGTTISFSNPIGESSGIQVEQLFERFYQGDSTRGKQGSGLGLAIVIKLAEAMEASVYAEEEHKCLTLCLTFKKADA